MCATYHNCMVLKHDDGVVTPLCIQILHFLNTAIQSVEAENILA